MNPREPGKINLPYQHVELKAICVGLTTAGMLLLGGCMVGPNYTKVTAAAPPPPAYKELPPNWKEAQPNDELPKGKWWEMYGDPQLNALEEKINVSNQSLKASYEQYEAARALVRQYRAGLFPTVSIGPNGSRTKQSTNKAVVSTTAPTTYNDFSLQGDISYEVDLWGQVRRTVESARASSQASAADLENVRLSLHSELAVDYFSLRGLDAQKQLLDDTVKAYEKALELTRNRFNGGVSSGVDVAQAQTQLETTRAQDIDTGVQRAQYEHAIAVLTGESASTFSIPPSPLTAEPPRIPTGLPSQLLERRPDIAAAERRVAAANAQIGVAEAAYYPTLSISGAGGAESKALGRLIQGPSTLWSLGGSAIETVFDGGKRRAVTDQAKDNYLQTVANYRESVLEAFQQVEDNLAALRVLDQESKTQLDAVNSARHSVQLSTNRYKGGLATYLEVTTAQATALADERTSADLLTRRMTASVQLVKALGGGWDTSQLP